jgi:hypothetical protein
MAIHPEGMECSYNWDGVALNGATEAYVILHEVAHFSLASPERRRLIDFGLGPGPDTLDRDARRARRFSLPAREEDEAANVTGIIWEAQLGQPALASFLDQNWLEGLDRSAALISLRCSVRCAAQIAQSRRRAGPDNAWRLAVDQPIEPKRRLRLWADPRSAGRVRWNRFERRASTRARARLGENRSP